MIVAAAIPQLVLLKCDDTDPQNLTLRFELEDKATEKKIRHVANEPQWEPPQNDELRSDLTQGETVQDLESVTIRRLNSTDLRSRTDENEKVEAYVWVRDGNAVQVRNGVEVVEEKVVECCA